MDKEKLQGYTARVTQANRSELVVIVYELILNGIEEAKAAYESCDLQTYEKELKRVQGFLNELMGSLDYQYIISFELIQLYQFVNKRIITAIIKRKPDTLDSAKVIMERLLVGFQEVANQDDSPPVMENTQQLYAGLTYGKGKLNEVFVNVNEHSRGFKA
jgi:Flagellin-specific chaperone FliS